MLQKIGKYLLSWFTFALTLVSALFWVALRVNYSGISKFLGADTNPSFLVMNLPIMVCVLAWLGFALALLGVVTVKKWKWPTIAGLITGAIVTLGAVVVVLFGAKDYLRFISVHFWKSLAVSGCILVFALVLFFPVKGWRPVKAAFLALVILVAVVIGYQLRPCVFTYEPVVYAVEDEYQIVFSTSDSAIAWVEIGGDRYYDLYAGSMRSADKVHKITVDQSVLDNAKGYSIHAQQMIYRGPFGGYLGEELEKSYVFRPVDTSDGLNYYALSDVHEAVDAAIRSTSQEEMDFLVLLGDLVSMVETERDAQLANELAFGVTKGQCPVIYVRGNHEIKGEYGEVLYKYVGSKHQSFAYPVTLGEDVFAVVLDLGEDHEDDWWEYYGTAQFDRYRQEQTEMLEALLDAGDYETCRYRMALCHIPVTYVDKNGYFESFRREWTQLLNEMDMDITLSGHKHKLMQFLPEAMEPEQVLIYSQGYAGKAGKADGGYMTDANFPGFLVGRRSLEQAGDTQTNGYTDYVGMRVQVDFAQGRQVCHYVNSNREILTAYYSFVGAYEKETFSDVVTALKRPQ